MRVLLVFSAMLFVASSAYAQCTKDTDCKGDRICVNGECVAPSSTFDAAPAPAQQPARVRPRGVMFSLAPGVVFGAGGAGMNIDECVGLQLSGGESFLWTIQGGYHVVFGGYGFTGKTGPTFNLTGKGTKGIMLQILPQYKIEVITGNNSVGDYGVHLFGADVDCVVQHVTQGGFLVGGGGGLTLLFTSDAGEPANHKGGVVFGLQGIFHIGGAF